MICTERLERLIANRALHRILLLWLILLPLTALAAWLLSGLLADRIVAREIRSMLGVAGGGIFHHAPDSAAVARGAELLAPYGISEQLDPRLMPDYPDIRRLLFWGITLFGWVTATLSAGISYLHTDRVYADLDRIAGECMQLESLETRLPRRGSAGGSVRRLCGCIQHVADFALHAADSRDAERRELRDTLTDFSHQMKASLAVIRLNRDMLDELSLPDSDRERLSREIEMQLDGMERLVMQMLRLARLEASAVQYDYSADDLAGTCRLAAERTEALMRQKGITCTVTCDPDGEAVTMPHDRVWLCEAIENLLKNAAEHAACSRVDIALSALPGAIRLTVTDDGRGIPFPRLRRMFDRFQVTDAEQPGSTGVGMAIAKQVFAAHGGAVSVYSEPGGGTQFLVIFIKK